MPRLLPALLTLLVVAPASAADPTYWQDVRPILRKHCTVCHSERKLAEPEVSAGLALDRPELVRKGGKSPVLVPGQPDKSLLVTLLTTKDKKRAMPLDADPLPADQIAVVRKWVAAGAPEGVKPADDTQAVAATPARPVRVRKLDVTFATKATPTKGAGPLELVLPVGPLPPVAAVAFSPDGKRLAAGVYGRVTVWDLATARPAKVLTNVLGAVNDLKWSPDGKLLAVAGGQPSPRDDLRLFDTADWKRVASLGGHLDVVSGVSFTADGKRLASASFDKTVRVWDVADPKAPKLAHTFAGHSDFVYAVAFGPKGDWYATASKDRTSRVVDAATGQGRLTFSGMDQEVLSVAVRPDGQQVATSGFEPQIHWWDATTAERLKRQAGHGEGVYELAFDPKGTVAVSAGADRTVRVWSAGSAAAVKTIPTGTVTFAVAVDPAAKRVASGGADGAVRLWDAATARPLATLWSGPGPGDAGDWLAVTPEGYVAASPGAQAQAKWLSGGKPLAAGDAVAKLANPALVAKAAAGEAVPEAFGK